MKTQRTMTRGEHLLISEIAKRAVKLWQELNQGNVAYDLTEAGMDLTAAHLDIGLDLPKLLAFPDADFGHDVFGIRQHMNRRTEKLNTARFVPRCAA